VNRLRSRRARILIAGLAALVLTVPLLGFSASSRGAGQRAERSSNVAVVPGFTPAAYPGFNGVPALPTGSPDLAAYHFTQLPTASVTAAALQPYDTVILYGIRWNDIPAAGRAAINGFAATHKVLIWDADGTGSQSYSTFVHPFSVSASGENFHDKPNDSVVTFPSAGNFLASDKPGSPYYLDPKQLVTGTDELKDMSAMASGTKNWVPALIAANKTIPQGGWPLAWSYGDIRDHTGLTVYSGIDADLFKDSTLKPNNAVKELAIQLAAPFRQTPDSSCASNCGLPSGGGGSAHASCSLVKPPPKHWVRGRVVVKLKTSVATGIRGRVVTRSGHVLASRPERGRSVIPIAVQTRHRLRSNRIARLRAQILINRIPACTKPFRLKVDNKPPRLLKLSTTFDSTGGHRLNLRVSERSSMKILGRHVGHRRLVFVEPHRTIHVLLSAKVRKARLVLRDRAGNRVVRKLVW
jgi:hypothetical protein